MFDAITSAARAPHWYRDGGVPDTIDGRFRVVATLAALATIRLESGGPEGIAASAALTERFVEVMEAEHREMGLGDPGLGRKVQKLVGALAGRVELWRGAVSAEDWRPSVARSLRPEDTATAPLEHDTGALRLFWAGLQRSSVSDLAAGQIA